MRDGQSLEPLSSTFRGELLQAPDAGYEAARKLYNGMIDKRPWLIARCADVADVIATVKFARDRNLRYQTGAAMQRGFWNIPVPAERRVVAPDALLIPLVGYDAAGYRLGYGGGYYDRTLAALAPRPFCIGVAYDDSQLETIHPQPHDIPMNLIVTERSVLQLGG